MNYGFAIDTRSCIGCHACSVACKSENQVPLGVHRTWVTTREQGEFPDVRRSFQVNRCNHCSSAPCVAACPVTAMYQRSDGIVEFDSDICIGCKACIQACPYDAIHLDPDSGTAAKCHYCAHRVEVGQEPACVVVCPAEAITAGDLDDPASPISVLIASAPTSVRRPECGTQPNLFYIDAEVPEARPPAAFMFSDLTQPEPEGDPAVVWNAQHEMHWHWPIPTYLITKALAGGLMLAVMPSVMGHDDPSAAMTAASAIAVALMGITSGLLLYDLERPERFLSLFTRPQWRSWVARAAWILAGFTVLSTAWLAAEILFPNTILRVVLAALTAPLALMTGTYTALLFRQCRGRALWQDETSFINMAAQTVSLGSLGAMTLQRHPHDALQWIAVGAILIATVIGTQTAFAARWRKHVIGSSALLLAGAVITALAPGLAGVSLITIAVGFFVYEYAYVMAPQHIPNA